MEGGGSNRGREEEWREVQRMEVRRTDGGGKRDRGRDSLVTVRHPVSLGRSRYAVSCGLVVVPSFRVLIVLLSSCIVARHCCMSLG